MRSRMKHDMLGRNVEALRKRLGDTQDQFADRLDVSQGTVSRWGQSMPRGDQLMKLSMLAGVLPSDFTAIPLDEAPRGAYISQPALERAIVEAWPDLPPDADTRARFLASYVLDAVRLPSGLVGEPGNDLTSDEGAPAKGAPPRKSTKRA